MKRVLVLLARAPSARGKTRLTSQLPDERARSLRERLFLDTLAVARATGLPIVVSFTPDEARDEMSHLAADVTWTPQRGEELGARMRNAMNDGFAGGAESVVLIGSDLPTLPPHHLLDAFAMLDADADVVFGRSEDGGFYLVGARGAMPDIFHGVTWSTPQVINDVVDAAHRAELMVAYAPEWWDIDRLDDLQRVLTDSPLDAAPHVRAWLADGDAARG